MNINMVNDQTNETPCRVVMIYYRRFNLVSTFSHNVVLVTTRTNSLAAPAAVKVYTWSERLTPDNSIGIHVHR